MDEVRTFFKNFLEKKWDENKAYDLAYFTERYSIRYNVAQYYLRKATYDKKLCCVKVRNKTYYMSYKWREHFKPFEQILDYVKVIE